MPPFVSFAEPQLTVLRPARPRLPRVLFALTLDPGKKFGSMEEQIVLLGHAFRKEGGLFQPLFICETPAADVSQFRQHGIQAECLELRRFRCRTLWKLWRLIRRERIDAVHWNFVHPLANAYLWALTLLTPRVGHIYTDHNSRTFPQPPPSRGWRRIVKQVCLKRYRKVWGVSKYIHEQLTAQGVWSNLDHCLHFINTQRFRPDAQRRSERRQALRVDDRFVLLSVGQLIADKGMDVAIRAMAMLPDNVLLWIAGEGPEKSKLEALIVEMGLQERVQLLGLQRNVEPFMQAADCFVCPSLWGEAAGLVNLEAHACGLPIVASRIGGIPEYVVEGRSGILFEPGNERELAAGVRRLCDDGHLRATMSREARAVALERYAPETRLPEILDMYRHW